MDEFSYIYNLTAGHKKDNKLYQVTDNIVSSYADDLESQGSGNYAYDSIGCLDAWMLGCLDGSSKINGR